MFFKGGGVFIFSSRRHGMLQYTVSVRYSVKVVRVVVVVSGDSINVVAYYYSLVLPRRHALLRSGRINIIILI